MITINIHTFLLQVYGNICMYSSSTNETVRNWMRGCDHGTKDKHF